MDDRLFSYGATEQGLVMGAWEGAQLSNNCRLDPFDKMYHTICLTIIIFNFKTILSLSNESVINYNAKLYRDIFNGYQKETGPWRNATADDGGTELVTVEVSLDLYTIDSVVGDDVESGHTCVCPPFAEWSRANNWAHPTNVLGGHTTSVRIGNSNLADVDGHVWIRCGNSNR